jgi:hypothetical protein
MLGQIHLELFFLSEMQMVGPTGHALLEYNLVALGIFVGGVVQQQAICLMLEPGEFRIYNSGRSANLMLTTQRKDVSQMPRSKLVHQLGRGGHRNGLGAEIALL